MDQPRKPFKKPGRPELQQGKKECFIRARLTGDEYKRLLALEKELGMNHTDLIRHRLLDSQHKQLINSREVLTRLDVMGAELGRAGNNINQLARHANILNKRGMLNETLIIEFNLLFREYARIRNETEKSLRQIIRLIRG
jgi:hypothetical protein